MSKNRLWFVGIGLVVLGTLVVFGLWFREGSLTKNAGDDGSVVSESMVDSAQKTEKALKADTFEADKNILINAVTKGDIGACETIQNAILKVSCTETATMIRAKNEKNPTLCESLIDASKKAQCQEKAGQN